MDIINTFKLVHKTAAEENIIKENKSFEAALSELCSNFETDTDGLLELFGNGEYWHSLMILDFLMPGNLCISCIDMISDYEDVDKFIRKLANITNNDWAISDITFDNSDDVLYIQINDNLTSPRLEIPGVSYSLGEEAMNILFTYLNSQFEKNTILSRGIDCPNIYYLPNDFIQKLKDRDVFDAQGDPESVFY